MNALQDKIIALQQRLRRSNAHNFNFDFKEFYEFITQNDYTLSMIAKVHSEIAFEELQRETDGTAILKVFKDYRNRQLTIASKYHRVYYLLRHLEYIYTQSSHPYGYVERLDLKENNSVTEGFVDVCVAPIVDFLTEGLSMESQVLALLVRYKRFKEWFDREEFFENYERYGRSEDYVDMDLRKFLFTNGIEHPFSTPKSPSGRTDIIANLDTNDPLVMEVKILDAQKGYGKSRVSDGFAQCVKYADDYNKNVGYYVIYNADEHDKEVVFESDNPTSPTKIAYNGKSYFILVININPKGKYASNIKKLNEIRITLAELTKEVPST